MYYHKYPLSANFEYVKQLRPNHPFKTARGAYRLNAVAAEGDIYQFTVTGKGWETNESQAGLQFPRKRKGLQGAETELVLTSKGAFTLKTKTGQTLLKSLPGHFFGQCGAASIFEFVREEDDAFYGMGEKWSGLEHSGKTTKFWNTDVWADFNPESYINGKPASDPTYLSIPYLIIKRGDTFIGLLLDNPHATFMSTKSTASIAGQMKVKESGHFIHLGAEEGQPNLTIIYGPSLPELTQKVQRLMGTTPLPPAWALGYQQCRWGYQSEKQLLDLDRNFRKHGIPVDGLWLDIDYMDGYRVFSFDPGHFPNPSKAMAKLNKRGRRVVPILDPGVKLDKTYAVYQRGRRARAFCLNPQGQEYVGMVWPGETVFPDYSTKEGRAWWTKEVAQFASLGIYGAWLDMNDPATGSADNAQMLFDQGKKSHNTFHNQYALGMAQATREGFLTAHPNQRPFSLSRSGFTGSGRHTAVWTGDNYSNYHHLRNSIATTLNLALSGIPFNGPDAGGFGGDAWPELICDWFKAGFLFPFFRNHCLSGRRDQEPWAFDKETLDVLRQYIRLRYRFRTYLYQLFASQESTGDAILRPLFYDFPSTPELPLEKIDDQFMVGPHILQAPFVDEKQGTRTVILPGNGKWFDAAAGRWRAGGTTVRVKASKSETPIYIRDGAVLPLARLAPEDHGFKPTEVDFHVFLSGNARAESNYVFDDGNSFEYQSGKRSEVTVRAERSASQMTITLDYGSKGYGEGSFTFTTENAIKRVTINGRPAAKTETQGVPITRARLTTWKIS